MLTSFLYREVEFNDGIAFSVPKLQGIDDPNPADATWAYRKGAVPVQTKLDIREGMFVFNFNIVAVRGETALQYQTKLQYIRQLFNTKDPTFYQLKRQRPHEATYKYLEVAPRQVAIDELGRKVSVTFQTADKEWKALDLTNAQQTIFDAGISETITVTYDGAYPVEPIISFEATTASSTGPTPLYYREITAYTVGRGALGFPQAQPILIASGWNTSGLVSVSKMRSDGLDISVQLSNGTVVNRVIAGTEASRSIWVRPNVWPALAAATLVSGPGVGNPADPPGARRAILAADTSLYCLTTEINDWPATGKIQIDNETISYSSITVISQQGTSQQLKLAITRGVDGTTAADHYSLTPIKVPLVLRINYGYAVGYAQVFYNDLSGWPFIDYDTSTNDIWQQTTTFSPSEQYTWYWSVEDDPNPLRYGERIVGQAESNAQIALYGTYDTGLSGEVLLKSQPSNRTHHRLRFAPPTNFGRLASHLRVVFKLKGGPTSYPDITVRLCKVSHNGTIVELYRNTYTSGTEGTVDTGYLATDTRWLNAQYYFVQLVNASPSSSPVRNVRIDGFYTKFEQDIATYYPTFTSVASATEYGLGTGVFPISFSFINSDDVAGQSFTVETRGEVTSYFELDCYERSTLGINLSEVSYRNGTWLRLMPGQNDIVFTGFTGTGQFLVTIIYRTRT